MQSQNFKNHKQFAPKSFYAALLMGLIVFTVAIFQLISSTDKTVWFLLAIQSIGLVIIGYFSRSLALKAQDRAIRAEENLRHFVLTSRVLPKQLSIHQIIALRFASDEELESLTKLTTDKNLSAREIKELIVNWRADYYRV